MAKGRLESSLRGTKVCRGMAFEIIRGAGMVLPGAGVAFL